MELSQHKFAIMFILQLAIIAMVATPILANEKEDTPLFSNPSSVTERCYQAAYSTLNETYIQDSEFAAFSVWHKLMKQGIACTLLVGNLSISNESITQCDSIWVVVEGIAIDGWGVHTDPQYQEGYPVASPQQYRELMDAIADYQNVKSRYISAVDTYNTLLTQAAKDNLEVAKTEYFAANNRLIQEIL